MAERSIAIVGAGLAGLSTGCYAQMNGYQTRIFERHTRPGGVAAAWERGGYTIDGGIHFLWGHKQGQSNHGLFRELGVLETNRFLDLKGYRFTDEASGKHLDATGGLDRFGEGLKAISPGDARRIDGFVAPARAMSVLASVDMGMNKPRELTGLFDRLRQMWGMRAALRYFGGEYGKSAREYSQGIGNALVRRIVENAFVPEAPVWFASMMLGMLAEGELGVLEGGSGGFVAAIEGRYKRLGGEVNYGATVEEVMVENDRAVGVRLADGSQHRAGIVVSAADGYSTIFKMLGGRYVDENIENRYRNWRLFRPIVMVSFGVGREFAGEPSMNLVFLERPFPLGDQSVEGIFIRIFNYSPKFAPPGKTVVQVLFETEWDFWNQLHEKDRPGYGAEKERVAGEVLERLEAHYPGISSQVQMTDVATPYTMWRYTRNHRGAYEGWLPTAETLMARVQKTLPGLENFYMAGQWVTPGGGVPPCLYSGRQVVQILCHRERRTFSGVET